MGILSQQNILGDTSLGEAIRPGTDTSAADYAFQAPMIYQMEEGNIENPKFMTPSSYSFDKSMGTVTKSDATGTYTGVDGESITLQKHKHNTGLLHGNRLADSQGTNLTSAAEVIAGKADLAESATTPSSVTATESDRNKTVTPGTNTAVASGGDTPTYDEGDKYNINKSDLAASPQEGTADVLNAQMKSKSAIHQRRIRKPAAAAWGGHPGDTGRTLRLAAARPGIGNLLPSDAAPGTGSGSPPAVGSDAWLAAEAKKQGMRPF